MPQKIMPFLFILALCITTAQHGCYKGRTFSDGQPAHTALKGEAETSAPGGDIDYRGAKDVSNSYGWLSRMESGKAYAQDKPAEKQLVYNAEINVMVENYKSAEAKIKETADKAGGYVSDTRSSTNYEGKTEGSVKIRVPSAQFKETMKALAAMGEVKSQREWTEDVTEQYIDVTARIEAQKTLETRLMKLMDTPNSKLADLIAVESKLADVRSQIEQSQGKLRYLNNQIAFSTINVTLYEPSSVKAQKESIFRPIIWAAEQVGYVFFGSIGVLMLIIIGGLPWVFLIFFLAKWTLRKRKASQTSKEASVKEA